MLSYPVTLKVPQYLKVFGWLESKEGGDFVVRSIQDDEGRHVAHAGQI